MGSETTSVEGESTSGCMGVNYICINAPKGIILFSVYYRCVFVLVAVSWRACLASQNTKYSNHTYAGIEEYYCFAMEIPILTSRIKILQRFESPK